MLLQRSDNDGGIDWLEKDAGDTEGSQIHGADQRIHRSAHDIKRSIEA